MARWLRGVLPPEIGVVEHDGEATSLLARLEGAESVCLIDASASAAPVGTVRRFDVAAAPLPQGAFGMSTHGLGLAEAISDGLGRSGAVWGVAGGGLGRVLGDVSVRTRACMGQQTSRLVSRLQDFRISRF